MLNKRSSGLLVHLTSLPGPHGIGDLGPSAFQFIEHLQKSGQTWWQMFPLGPLSFGNSPYSTLSAFAMSVLFISLEKLHQDGLLSKGDITPPIPFSTTRVDYEATTQYKLECVEKAFNNYHLKPSQKIKKAFEQFRKKNKTWLLNFSLYKAIKDHYNGAPWWNWDKEIRHKKTTAIKKISTHLKKQIQFQEFIQFLAHKQWDELHAYAKKSGVHLIGDLPIFVALDSADVWSNPKIFHLDKKGNPAFVAGVPPDAFSSTGQLWGNPVYRWDILKKQGYKWWIDRLKKSLDQFDAVRLDHFIGFTRFWAVPGHHATAELGTWKKGPGAAFFKKVFKTLTQANIIAEDLGSLTPEVEALRDQFFIPGMKVLQFSFETHPGAEVNRPHNFARNCVVYTGTHDNNTTKGWFEELIKKEKNLSNGTTDQLSEREFALQYLKSNGKEIHWDMVRQAMMSKPNIAIFPIQDVLGLGTEARMNVPGSMQGNWEWRFNENAWTKEIEKRLRKLTQTFDRC